MRPAKTRTIGHITKVEKEQRREAEKALAEYPTLTSTAPEWLDDLAAKEWERIVPLLKANAPVSELDVGLIATHCTLYSTVIKCTEEINKNGVIVDTKRGPQQSPYFMARDKAIKEMKSIDSQMGLSPQSRVRLEIHKAVNSEESQDKFEAMLSWSTVLLNTPKVLLMVNK